MEGEEGEECVDGKVLEVLNGEGGGRRGSGEEKSFSAWRVVS